MQIENENNHQKEAKHAASQGAQSGGQNDTKDVSDANPEDEVQSELQLAAEQLERAIEERDAFKDRFMRSVAESENLRKRFERERADLLKYGHEKVLSDLLPVLDSFEKALSSAEDATESYSEGVKMVHKLLLDVVAKHGLKAVEAAGQPFDPNVHQGIQRIESDVAIETVRDEFQKGYTLNDRLIRPAVVSVAVPNHAKEGDG